MDFLTGKSAVEIPFILSQILDTCVNGITLSDPNQPDNPLVYANEALRYVTMPQLVSMPLYFSLLGLFISTVLMAGFGFRRFHHMASSQNGR